MANPSLQIVVGENGRRCGLATAVCRGLEVRVLVLPKVWRPQSNKSAEADSAAETPALYWVKRERGNLCVSIACWEGDRLSLDAIDVGSKVPAFERCVCIMTRKAQQRVDADKPSQDGVDAETLPDGDKASVDDGGSKSPLIRIWSGANAREPHPGPEDKPFSKYWGEFYGLWYYSWKVRSDLRALMGKRRNNPLHKQLREQLCKMSGALATTSLLVPFLHYSFVSLIEELLDHVRPGYSRVTRPTACIKGRLNTLSAAIVAEGGGTRCVCTFDEFGLDTPIMQVIRAALSVVVDYEGELSQLPNTQETAVWLKGFMQGVRSISATRAFRQGVALYGRLPKADSAWENALRLACLVIDGKRGVSPAAGDLAGVFGWANRGSKGFVFDVNTASIWQNIVSRVWPRLAHEIHDTVVPWHPKMLRGMKADDVHAGEVNTGGHSRNRWDIIDAKYKRFPKMPSAVDQRQMFTYVCVYPSMAFDGKREVPYVAMAWLVYPEFHDTPKDLAVRLSTSWRRLPSDAINDCWLTCIETAFPKPDNCLNQRCWNRYMRIVREDMCELINRVWDNVGVPKRP